MGRKEKGRRVLGRRMRRKIGEEGKRIEEKSRKERENGRRMRRSIEEGGKEEEENIGEEERRV